MTCIAANKMFRALLLSQSYNTPHPSESQLVRPHTSFNLSEPQPHPCRHVPSLPPSWLLSAALALCADPSSLPSHPLTPVLYRCGGLPTTQQNNRRLWPQKVTESSRKFQKARHSENYREDLARRDRKTPAQLPRTRDGRAVSLQQGRDSLNGAVPGLSWCLCPTAIVGAVSLCQGLPRPVAVLRHSRRPRPW